jgi:hypothetical protein
MKQLQKMGTSLVPVGEQNTKQIIIESRFQRFSFAEEEEEIWREDDDKIIPFNCA